MLETFLTFCNIVQNSGDFFYPHFTFLNSHFGMWSFCCQPLKCSSGSNMLICYEKTGNVVLKQMLPVTTFFFFYRGICRQNKNYTKVQDYFINTTQGSTCGPTEIRIFSRETETSLINKHCQKEYENSCSDETTSSSFSTLSSLSAVNLFTV